METQEQERYPKTVPACNSDDAACTTARQFEEWSNLRDGKFMIACSLASAPAIV